MRRRLVPAAYCGELLLNPVLFIALACAALALTRPGLDLRFFALAACGVAMKCLGDALVYRRLRGERPRLLEVLAMPFKDLLMGGIWLLGAFRRKVSWRGNAMRIEKGSRLVPVEPAEMWPQEASPWQDASSWQEASS
jgi:hypothetical protein